eukprot:gene27947-36072_t
MRRKLSPVGEEDGTTDGTLNGDKVWNELEGCKVDVVGEKEGETGEMVGTTVGPVGKKVGALEGGR